MKQRKLGERPGIKPGSLCFTLVLYIWDMEEKGYANNYICSTRVTGGRKRPHELIFEGKTWYPVQPGDIGKRKFSTRKLHNPRTGKTITLYY